MGRPLAHIHLPDGVLALQWVALYWLISIVLLGAVAFYFNKSNRNLAMGSLSIAGAATALTFVIFQVEIPIFGGVHLNFTPMLGILVGPVIGVFSAMIINILSASLGHGGWGPIGLNYLLNSVEIVLAFSIFYLLRRRGSSPVSSAALATFVALTASNALMIASLSITGIQGVGGSAEELALRFSVLAAANEVMAMVEAIVTGFLVTFLWKLKPDLLGGKKA
jgi:cobalt/nickel transport system permease protein